MKNSIDENALLNPNISTGQINLVHDLVSSFLLVILITYDEPQIFTAAGGLHACDKTAVHPRH